MDGASSTSKRTPLLAYLLVFGLPIIGILAISGLIRLLLDVSATLAKWGIVASIVVVVLSVIALLPLAAFKATRRFAGAGLTAFSTVVWATLWFASISFTYHEWGSTAALIGLLVAGVGIVPMALLASLFSGDWFVLGTLLGLIVSGFALAWAGTNTLDNAL